MAVETFPVQINWPDISPEKRVEDYIYKRAAKLTTFFGQINGCQVVVEPLHQHRIGGNLYHIRIDLEVPDEVLVVNREPELHETHKDLHVAIRDAFDEAQRQLENYADKIQKEVKFHRAAPAGRISKLFPQEGYGFIRVPDGSEFYFNRNSLVDADFNNLRIGMEVVFREAPGEKGPQARNVRLQNYP